MLPIGLIWLVSDHAECHRPCLLYEHWEAEAQKCPSQWASRDCPTPGGSGLAEEDPGAQESVPRGGHPQQPPLCKEVLVLKGLLVFCSPT